MGSLRPSTIAIGFLALVLVSSVAIGGVAAQTTPETTTPNGSTNGTATDAANQSTPLDASNQRDRIADGGGGSVSGIAGGNTSESVQDAGDNNSSTIGGSTTARGSNSDGLFGFNMTEDVIHPTANTTRRMAADSTVWVLNQSLEMTVGTPVPEDDDDSGIVFVPTNDPWAGLYNDFFIPYVAPLTAVLALIGMIAECGIMPWRALKNPTYSQTRAFVGFVITLVALAFTMPMVWFMHAFVDVLATNVAPDVAELTQSTQGLMNLSAGSILGVIAAYIIGLSQALLLALVYALRYAILYIIPWFLPLLIAITYNAPHERLSNLASHLTWQYIGLLIQAVPVAFLFRAAFEMEWDFGFGGLMGVLASAGIFLVAAGFPLLTSIGMFKSSPSMQSVAAGAAGYVAGSSAADYARQAPGQAARAGYARMPNVKAGVSARVGAVKTAIAERVGSKNSPERGQTTIHDYEDREHPNTGVPKRGKL